MSLGLFYSKIENYKLVGFSNSDWCGDIDDRKSTLGYVLFMGNTTFTWLSKKQPIVILSTCEAEYVAASWCVCVMSHIGWGGEQTTIYKGVETIPLQTRFKALRGSPKGKA